MENAINQGLNEQILSRGVEEIFELKNLKEKLDSGKKLRVKHGVDPTGDKIHLGRASQYLKLRDFQDAGHQIVLIIGDFTARIGDASDKDAMRKIMTSAEIKENFKTYTEQIGKILDMSKVEVRYNSEWLERMPQSEIIKLCQNFTAQQLIQRRNFKERWEAGKPIGLHELLYPIFQGYDSVAIGADVEIGGSDQLFNLQAGRIIQQLYQQKPQDIMTLKMVWGLDGRKMSTSWGNVINMLDGAQDMFGKVMSMRDEYIFDYFEMCTRLPSSEILSLRQNTENGALSWRDAKARLAREIVALYHDCDASAQAEEHFNRVFRDKEMPEEMPEITVEQNKINVLDLLMKTGGVPSKQEAKRLILQKGIKINTNIVDDWKTDIELSGGEIIQIGKRKFIKIKKFGQ